MLNRLSVGESVMVKQGEFAGKSGTIIRFVMCRTDWFHAIVTIDGEERRIFTPFIFYTQEEWAERNGCKIVDGKFVAKSR